jgi:hypothetical protein
VFHSIAFYFQPTEREIQVTEIRSLKPGIEERLSKKFRNKGTLRRIESDKLS